MIVKKAYATITFKAVDEENRILEGIASTPAPDRMNDVVEVEGIEFKLPLPFLNQHNSREPIGNVIEAKVKAGSLVIKVQIAPAGTAPFIDLAWNLIKAGLVRGLSIGFRVIEESYDRELGGYRYLRSELLEVSAVTVPANSEASITAVKSAALAALAASGHEGARIVRLGSIPGVSGKTTDSKEKSMTITEQIKQFEAKRQAHTARMSEIMNKAGDEGRTLDETESQEYDGLQSDVKSIDEHLKRLREHEKQLVTTATAITEKSAGTSETGSQARGKPTITVVGPTLPKGTAFVRLCMAMAHSAFERSRSGVSPLEIARANKHWKETTPEVERFLADPMGFARVKAAVAAGTTTADGWASQLADYSLMASEFIEYLRPQTIIGKLPGLRRVPFNIEIPLQDGGSTVGWVGEGGRKPLTKLSLDTITFRFFKAAGIVVLTEELVRFSNPSAEALVRQDLANAIIQFLDEQFIAPTVAGSQNVYPASVTYGAAHGAASGTTADYLRADFKTILTSMLGAEIVPDQSCSWVMSPVQAVAISLILNALDQPEFPDLTAEGGRLLGYNVVTSNSVAAGVISFLKGSEILLADDDAIQVDISREASLVMDDGGSPAVTTLTSLWQENKVGLRVERTVNWARRRDKAVYYLTACDYK
jgi:HK97 family phage major capsid protein/HK97 family phage prohead protease